MPVLISATPWWCRKHTKFGITANSVACKRVRTKCSAQSPRVICSSFSTFVDDLQVTRNTSRVETRNSHAQSLEYRSPCRLLLRDCAMGLSLCCQTPLDRRFCNHGPGICELCELRDERAKQPPDANAQRSSSLSLVYRCSSQPNPGLCAGPVMEAAKYTGDAGAAVVSRVGQRVKN